LNPRPRSSTAELSQAVAPFYYLWELAAAAIIADMTTADRFIMM
jgi:hypothetical protein